MARHLQRDLDNLARDLLTMGAMVEEATNKAITALARRNRALAREVTQGDPAINDQENLVEENALKILALHQPVAADLRFIITALKVNNDLERIGDHAVSIGERTDVLAGLDPVPVPDDFQKLVTVVQQMVHDSLNALVERDAKLARSVCAMDDEVDRIHRLMYAEMQAVIRKDVNLLEPAINTISATRHLERIADLATNISEDVVFMVEGEILRHNY
ncbi:MAG: phosphate signaling complex protein PhoU [Candidatus Krumholzibacteria bacterium]|nr:phosphate signaling complex protein PhoU [Candidatus Krumholzibacteria bacterium]MDH4335828.1 phosphate signaling complex protein PhoU [Candidatus Krumholzibacteria bacterium]MDH5269354.1 phosphate signaling complex protein PhoU [Candidatus Krumholzibacteria bacterium]